MGDTSVAVLKGVNLTLRTGDFIAIEGRSGSGKSTLLHILAGLDGTDGGRVAFAGSDYTTYTDPPARYGDLFAPQSFYHWLKVTSLISARWIYSGFIAFVVGVPFGIGYWIASAVQAATGSAVLSIIAWAFWIVMAVCSATCVFAWAIGIPTWLLSSITFAVLYDRRERPKSKLRNREFGFVFQFYYLLPELNVLENTMLAPMIEHSWLRFRSTKRARSERATKLLEQLGMGHRLKHRPSQLSGGERQRVAIARALMNNPRVLFADEPTGNLDAETGRQIMNLLESLHQKSGQTIVMVTHDRALAREADRVLVLRDGRLEKAE
jgi:ABC-type lipoprotein export system ATPase subunit